MTWVNQGMQNLIPLINRIQDAFTQIGTTPNIDLPQIAVVGGQSSGKSSVLESFVGKDFLPRGSGIVTRRPLILQLVNDPANEYGEFLHKKGHKFVDFDQIRKEIEDETDRVTGDNRGISPIPINLCVCSPHVLNLTLIDLPGMTKVPVGDQPADIEQQIRDMILTYIARETCLILAVTPANSDLATSDALKLAKEVDKEGNRTILVLTKLDLMDAGTDAMDVLTGKLVPVKLGIIGVVNRSQADINANKSVQESLKDEAKFLNKKYPTLASINGTPYLAKTLNRLLMHHIRECLPKLKLRVSTMMIQCQTILRGYGEPVTDKARTLLQIITHFATAYNSTIDGTSRNIETTELSGGARICYIFHETFSSALEKLNPMENLSQLDILTAIRNATGSRPALFIPEVSFELLVKRQIQRLEEPSLNCVDLVYEEMLRIVQHCGLEIQQEMQRFPHLYERIHEVITSVLSSRLAPTKEFVSNLIAIQLAYVNSRHPEFSDAAMINALQEAPSPFQSNAASLITEDFNELQLINKKIINAEIGEKLEYNGEEINRRRHQQNESTKFAQKSAYSSFRINPFFKRTNQAPENSTTQLTNGTGSILTRTTEKTVTRVLSFREKRDCTVIERLIKSYFVIVRKTIQDTVPKAIMNFLVNNIRDNLQSELVRQLYKEDDFDALLAESEIKAQKRAETVEMLEALNRANQLISEIRETHIW